jgi:hypothetical protein
MLPPLRGWSGGSVVLLRYVSTKPRGILWWVCNPHTLRISIYVNLGEVFEEQECYRSYGTGVVGC